MMIFSFEADTLEVALKEQQDMVDKIFIVESSATYKGVSIHKPSLSEFEQKQILKYNSFGS